MSKLRLIFIVTFCLVVMYFSWSFYFSNHSPSRANCKRVLEWEYRKSTGPNYGIPVLPIPKECRGLGAGGYLKLVSEIDNEHK